MPRTTNRGEEVDEQPGRQPPGPEASPSIPRIWRRVALIQSTESSNAIEDIRAPRKRIEELVAQPTQPANRSEQEIAGYRLVLDTIHNDAPSIPFEPKCVEQLPGYMARVTGDRTAGAWKKLDTQVEQEHPDGTKVARFEPRRWARRRSDGTRVGTISVRG